MLKDISAYLEAAWAAEEFNRFTSNNIVLPLSMDEVQQRLVSIDPHMDVEIIGSTILQSNVTMKEYAIRSAQACFKANQPGSAIDKKREMIEQTLRETSGVFLFAKSA